MFLNTKLNVLLNHSVQLFVALWVWKIISFINDNELFEMLEVAGAFLVDFSGLWNKEG